MARSTRKQETVERLPYYSCLHCGNRRDRNVPRPPSWDAHLLDGKLVDSCSPSCRMYLGYTERKG